jgi:hypothetical protein
VLTVEMGAEDAHAGVVQGEWGQVVNDKGPEDFAGALMARIVKLINRMARFGAQRSLVPVTGCTGHVLAQAKPAAHSAQTPSKSLLTRLHGHSYS